MEIQSLTPDYNTCIQADDFDLESLNEQFKSMTPKERIIAFYECMQYMPDRDRVLLTSSFGTTAVYLLNLFHEVGIKQKVHFLDTTYHFEETLVYKNKLTQMFDLEVVEIKPEAWKNAYTTQNKVWETDPDFCCSINKVEPLQDIKENADFWISGLMAWQTPHRNNLDVFEKKNGVIKFYPLIDVEEEDVLQEIEEKQLPVHPLKPLGYESIGCKFCTFKGKGRTGRWSGNVKTECGLHR